MIELDKIRYEGTEDLLLDYTESDKKRIIDIVCNTRINSPRVVSARVLRREVKFNSSLVDILAGINFMIDWYSKNLPKDFKRPENIWQMANKEGVCLNFNRGLVRTATHRKGYITAVLHYIEPVEKVIGNEIRTVSVVGSFVHRLVALAWIPNPNNKEQVNHKDGDKLNNTVANLEWNTNLENIRHATKTGLRDTPAMRANGNGERNSQAILSKEKVKAIRAKVDTFKRDHIKHLSKKFEVTVEEVELALVFGVTGLHRPTVTKTITMRGGHLRESTSFKYKYPTEVHIRGCMTNSLHTFNHNLAIDYEISDPTIRDIIARRSWDYPDC